MTPDEMKALVAEARGVLAEWNRDRDWMPRSPLGMIERLADALEALSAHPAEETEWEYAMTTDHGGLSDFTADLAEVQEKVRAWNERADRLRRESEWRVSYPGAYVRRRRAGTKPGPWGPAPTS